MVSVTATSHELECSGLRAVAETPVIDPVYPRWLFEHLKDQRKFIQSLDPFPFDQPADTRSFYSLHQNDYLRLSNCRNAGAGSCRDAGSRAGAGEHYEVKRFTKFGFEWTYEGDSPQQLALAILVDRLGDNARAIRLSAPFMKQIVANLDNDWQLTGDEIDAAVRSIEKE